MPFAFSISDFCVFEVTPTTDPVTIWIACFFSSAWLSGAIAARVENVVIKTITATSAEARRPRLDVVFIVSTLLFCRTFEWTRDAPVAAAPNA